MGGDIINNSHITEIEPYNYKELQATQRRKERVKSSPIMEDIYDVIEIFQGFEMPIHIQQILSYKTLEKLIIYREQRVNQYFAEKAWSGDKYVCNTASGIIVTLVPANIDVHIIEEIIQYISAKRVRARIKILMQWKVTADIKRGIHREYNPMKISYTILISALKKYLLMQSGSGLIKK